VLVGAATLLVQRNAERSRRYCAVLRPGDVWLVGDGHPRSFDSPYFGPVLADHDSIR
jgi:type IV secretory pathway protease TraF